MPDLKADAMLFIDGTPYRLLWRATEVSGHWWWAQPLFVNDPVRMIFIPQDARITRIHTQHA